VKTQSNKEDRFNRGGSVSIFIRSVFLAVLVNACYGQNLDRIHAFDPEMRGQNPDSLPDGQSIFGPRSSPSSANSTGGLDEVQLQEPKPVGGTVSVDNLANPPSKAAIKIIKKAERYSEAGDHAKAIEILRNAPMDPAGAPYLHSRLGTEYLKSAQYTLAVPELEAAARLLPRESVHHSNLAYAYQTLGQLDRAETEARQAVNLDHSNAKARFLLGSILLNRLSTLPEAVTNLKLARQDVPSARFLLGQAYLFLGQRDAAQHEIQDFLSVATEAQKAAAREWIALHTNK
jgi:tetratricopeptide (TPR) repeat protein